MTAASQPGPNMPSTPWGSKPSCLSVDWRVSTSGPDEPFLSTGIGGILSLNCAHNHYGCLQWPLCDYGLVFTWGCLLNPYLKEVNTNPLLWPSLRAAFPPAEITKYRLSVSLSSVPIEKRFEVSMPPPRVLVRRNASSKFRANFGLPARKRPPKKNVF